jgi:sugar lactone lactonase YvrE
MTFSTKEIVVGHEAGKIYAFDLKTAKTSVILDKIAFANGIVYEKETNSVIFAELSRFKIWKYRLTDSKKELLIENLFGFPDNLKLNDQGQLLVGIPSTRSAFTEKLLQNPLAKKIAMYLP